MLAKAGEGKRGGDTGTGAASCSGFGDRRCGLRDDFA